MCWADGEQACCRSTFGGFHEEGNPLWGCPDPQLPPAPSPRARPVQEGGFALLTWAGRLWFLFFRRGVCPCGFAGVELPGHLAGFPVGWSHAYFQLQGSFCIGLRQLQLLFLRVRASGGTGDHEAGSLSRYCNNQLVPGWTVCKAIYRTRRTPKTTKKGRK